MYKIIVKHRKDGSKITMSFAIIILVLWVFIAFNYENPDYSYYANLFVRAEKGVTYHAVESGFWYMIKIAAGVGLNYSLFLKIYTLVAFWLIGDSILKYTERPSLVLILYMCYPFLLDIAQIRHFMATAIFIFAIRYLEEFNKKNLIKYCTLIFIASSQQIIAFAFFFFLLVYMVDQEKILKIVFMITIINVFTCKYILQTSIVRKIFSLRDKTVDYSGGYSSSQFLMYVCFYGMLLVVCAYINRCVKTTKNYKSFLYKISMYSMFFIPFIMIDFQYTRLFRSSIIIIYIFMTRHLNSLKKTNKYIILTGLLFMMSFVTLKLFGIGSSYYETLTLPVFKCNTIIKFIIS